MSENIKPIAVCPQNGNLYDQSAIEAARQEGIVIGHDNLNAHAMKLSAEIADLRRQLAAAQERSVVHNLRATEAEAKLVAAQINSIRYYKLREWMSSNVEEGWSKVCELAAVACWVGWEDFDAVLDDLPNCRVGLCSKNPDEKADTTALDTLLAAKEREAIERCAQLCEEQKVGFASYFEIDERIDQCATAIRALLK